MEKKVTTINIRADILDALRKLSKQENRSVSNYIETWMLKEMKKHLKTK